MTFPSYAQVVKELQPGDHADLSDDLVEKGYRMFVQSGLLKLRGRIGDGAQAGARSQDVRTCDKISSWLWV